MCIASVKPNSTTHIHLCNNGNKSEMNCRQHRQGCKQHRQGCVCNKTQPCFFLPVFSSCLSACVFFFRFFSLSYIFTTAFGCGGGIIAE